MSVAQTSQPKLIYFAERPKDLDHESFRARWRQHARLGMSQPRWRNVARYVHCDAVEVGGTALPISRCDGVAMVWYRSEESRLAHVTDGEAGPVMKSDEAETFAQPVREVAALCEEHVLRPCREARYKLFLRLWAPDGQAREDFRAWWLETFAPGLLDRLDAAGACRGYVQNHARGRDTGEAVPPPLCDCVDELATDDAEAAEVAISAALAEAAGRVGEVKVIWTEETLLYSR